MPDSLVSKIRTLGKGALSSEALRALERELLTHLNEQTYTWLASRVAADLAPAVKDLAASAVRPLENALNETRKTLEAARGDKRSAYGVADMATDIYAAWPEEAPAGQDRVAPVPQRFAAAHHEVVLM